LARITFKGYNPKKEINVGYGIQRPPAETKEMKMAFEQSCPAIKDKKYWLFLSRINPKKGIDVLIKAYNELVLEGHDLPELVIAGPTESSYPQKMIALAKANTHIHFSGMLSGDSKWGAFYNCEAYLLPSHQENFGIAIVEAMACKKPVLISKNINIWREIEQGNGGWILNEPNTVEIKNQLFELANLSPEVIEIKGENAFETFENKFLIDNCYVDFINALNSLI
jgi:glycosyltransferase involved in cell wall biosynthesis